MNELDISESSSVTTTSHPRVFLIDGMSLLFRSFYSMGTHLTGPDGNPIGAVYGFLKVVIKILKEQNPTHFAICWDLPQKTFRHELYTAYKANRKEPPSELIPQIHQIKDLTLRLKIPCYSLPGFEADDVAATLAKRFENEANVFILTSDKDYMQIVNDKIKIFSLKKSDLYEVIGDKEVYDYFGVGPEQVVDLLSLIGDSADNVPGVNGIGEKTAAKLLQEFGTLEKLYENLHLIKNKKAHDALKVGKDQVLLSRKLIIIPLDVPVEATLKDLEFDFTALKSEETRVALEELKMKSLVQTLFSEKTNESKKEKKTNSKAQDKASAASDSTEGNIDIPQDFSVPWPDRSYKLVLTREEMIEVLDKITDPLLSHFAFDTETTGLDTIESKPIGISLCFKQGEAFYIPAVEKQGRMGSLFEQVPTTEFAAKEVWEKLQDVLFNRTALLIAHNLKYDLHMLKNQNVDVGEAPIACTMVCAWLCDVHENTGFSLDALTLKYLNAKKIPTSALIGKHAGRQSMLEVPLDILSEYACEDADAVMRLWESRLKNDLEEKELRSLFFELEMPVLRLLLHMERTGVHIDSEYLGNLAHEMQEKLIGIEKNLHEKAGVNFKISSPKQLGDILFEKLKIHEELGFKGKLARTTQGYKTDSQVLEEFIEHPVIKMVQEYRELSKLLSTYAVALPQMIKQSTHRLHTSFNQIGTATGRLSSSEPNLQNIPIRTELGKKIRCAFAAKDSTHVILSADYSQIELRVLAHITQDKNMSQAFLAYRDIHRETAAQILGKSQELVTDEERSKAKTINFGIIYGMGAQRLAKQEEIPLAQAKEFIEKYFLTFAGVKHYIEKQRALAHEGKYAKTFFGRLRPIPSMTNANAMGARFIENIVINTPIQGTAADIMKIAMIKVAENLKNENLASRIILQVHDELVLEVPKNEIEKASQLVKTTMEEAVKLSVPLVVDVAVAENWLEAK